jgi:hypothetical protein
MTGPRRSAREDLLIGGLDDWADAAWALQSARLSGATDHAALRDLTLNLITEVLTEGYMIAGDIVAGEHVPWHGTPQEAAERIAREWIDEWGVEVPTPGAIVWLRNTPAGDEIARWSERLTNDARAGVSRRRLVQRML